MEGRRSTRVRPRANECEWREPTRTRRAGTSSSLTSLTSLTGSRLSVFLWSFHGRARNLRGEMMGDIAGDWTLPSRLSAMVGSAAIVAIDTRTFASVNGILALAVSAAPLLSAELAEAPYLFLSRFIPLFGKLLAELVRRVSIACENVRLRREQLFVLTHGAVTYALGDAIAQIALTPADAPQLMWEPSKTAFAALIGLVSDTLPFYHWASFLSSFDDERGPRRAALERRMPVIARKPGLLLPLKVVVHLATIQPFFRSIPLPSGPPARRRQRQGRARIPQRALRARDPPRAGHLCSGWASHLFVARRRRRRPAQPGRASHVHLPGRGGGAIGGGCGEK